MKYPFDVITSGSVAAGAPPIAGLAHAAVLTLRSDGAGTAGQVADAGFRSSVVSDLDALETLSPDIVVLSVTELEEGRLPRLQELHCDAAQGFGIGRPMPGADATDWLRAIRSPRSGAPGW